MCRRITERERQTKDIKQQREEREVNDVVERSSGWSSTIAWSKSFNADGGSSRHGKYRSVMRGSFIWSPGSVVLCCAVLP